jgi:hypothetical protein
MVHIDDGDQKPPTNTEWKKHSRTVKKNLAEFIAMIDEAHEKTAHSEEVENPIHYKTAHAS